MTVLGHYDDRFPQVGLGGSTCPTQYCTVSCLPWTDTNMTNCKIKNRKLLVSMVFVYPES